MLHTHAKNNFNTSKRPQPEIPAKVARASFPFKFINTKNSGQHGEGRTLITKQPKCSLGQNFRDSGKPAQLTRACRSPRQTRAKTKPNTSPLNFVEFLAQHVQCYMAAQGLPLPPPNLVRR